MSRFIENAKSVFPESVEECRKDGCELGMEELPSSHWLVDADGIAEIRRKSRCDYFFFCTKDKENWIALIEMKDGELGKGVSGQLQASAKYIEKKRALRRSGQVKFVPVAVDDGTTHRHILKTLQEKQVKFLGDDYEIITRSSGALLDSVLVGEKENSE